MDEKQHNHNHRVIFTNGKIVCEECILDVDKGKNECMCSCHMKGNLSCKNCKVYHSQV